MGSLACVRCCCLCACVCLPFAMRVRAGVYLPGIALYSSSDLYSWKYESLVLPVFNCTSPHALNSTKPTAVGTRAGVGKDASDYPPPSCKNGNGLDLERPKVVQCGGPGNGGKFVMWVRGTGYGNTPQLLGVLTADAPTGPFTFVSNRSGTDDPFNTISPGIKNYPPGYQFADATLFQDPATFKTYVYWRTRMTSGLDGPTGFRGMELTADCLGVIPASDTRLLSTPDREGPAMFLHGKNYYLYVSGTMGWEPTAMFLYRASNSQFITSLSLFQHGDTNRDLRCVLHPSTVPSGVRCKARLESRIDAFNPFGMREWDFRPRGHWVRLPTAASRGTGGTRTPKGKQATRRRGTRRGWLGTGT